MYEIKFTGVDLKNVAPGMKREIKKHNRQQLIKISAETKKRLKDKITTQNFGFSAAPLNREYSKQKVSDGYGSKLFIRKGVYLRSIRKKTLSDSEAIVFIDETARSENGTSYQVIAATLEYGSRVLNLPARPLWQTTFNEMQEETKNKNFGMRGLENDLNRIK